MRLTDKQQELIRVVAAGNDDGTTVDLDQLLERLSYKPTKAAVQFTIRALIGHELIEKAGGENRRGRKRVLFSVTDLGRHFSAPVTGKSFVSSAIDEEVLAGAEEYLE